MITEEPVRHFYFQTERVHI